MTKDQPEEAPEAPTQGDQPNNGDLPDKSEANEPAKVRTLNGEVTENAKVRRNSDGVVTSAVVPVRAPFFGEVHLTLRGDLASAYWSAAKGMRVSASVRQTGDREYVAESFAVLP